MVAERESVPTRGEVVVKQLNPKEEANNFDKFVKKGRLNKIPNMMLNIFNEVDNEDIDTPEDEEDEDLDTDDEDESSEDE